MTISPFAAREGTSAPQWPNVKKCCHHLVPFSDFFVQSYAVPSYEENSLQIAHTPSLTELLGRKVKKERHRGQPLCTPEPTMENTGRWIQDFLLCTSAFLAAFSAHVAQEISDKLHSDLTISVGFVFFFSVRGVALVQSKCPL